MSVAEAFFGIEIWKGTKLLESERYTYIKSAHLLTWRQMVAIEEMHSLIEENRRGGFVLYYSLCHYSIGICVKC